MSEKLDKRISSVSQASSLNSSPKDKSAKSVINNRYKAVNYPGSANKA